MNSIELAHEIINPLNIIVGCAELLKLEQYKYNVETNYNKYNKKNNNNIDNIDNIDNNTDINKKINYLDEIIKQSEWCCELLQFNIKEETEKDINLVKLIYEIINTIKTHPIVKNRNQKLNLYIDTMLYNKNKKYNKYEININKVYIKIAIKNLLLNSIKNTPYKGLIDIKLCINNINNNIDILIINMKNNKYNMLYNLQNKIYDKNYYFEKSNGYGLNVIDNLMIKMSGDWNIINDDNIYKVMLSLPK